MTGPGRRVDLNSDLGEGYGVWRCDDDEALLDVVTSANVACGFHAGDPLTMSRTVAAAAERRVVIGAQVSYPDLVGFGRRAMDVAPDQLTADVIYQLGALQGICRAAGTTVSYVKPHGALYNRIVVDEGQARAVVAALVAWDDALPLLTQPGSVAEAVAAQAGIPVVREGFADRGYTSDGRLVPRDAAGSVLTDPVQVAERATRLVVDGVVAAVDGSVVAVTIDSLCLHGDTPGAVTLARATRTALLTAGVEIRAFR